MLATVLAGIVFESFGIRRDVSRKIQPDDVSLG